MYYICVEDDRILSTDEIRAEYEQFKAAGLEGETATFSDYLRNCLTRYNGSLEPIASRINSLKRRRASVERLAGSDAGRVEIFAEEIAELDAEIRALEKYTGGGLEHE